MVFFGSVVLVSSTGPLSMLDQRSREAKAGSTSVPRADAVARLEKRVLQLEARVKAPPTFDPSQLEAQFKDLEFQLAAVQTQLGAFRVSDFDALKTKIDSAETANPKSIKTMMGALQTDIGNLHTRFGQLSQQAASVTAKRSARKSHHSRSK
ncbi:MAG: hypothetical protein ABI150_12495 [Nitrobacter sp.]